MSYRNANITLLFFVSYHRHMTVLLFASHHLQRNYDSQGFGWIIYHSGLFVLQVSTNLRLMKTKNMKENQSQVNEFKHEQSTERDDKEQ